MENLTKEELITIQTALSIANNEKTFECKLIGKENLDNLSKKVHQLIKEEYTNF
ncbi:hypothetical protein UFOVP187_10 [uncultured Caudovirales phage]|uniref:Uncharacterized protein n=1 Tax=uncultured Caudovirales phage TaxID=2100421 RepID=A0A6J7WFK4_9CAUD|nr:hypothetical protein UFOVP187_10 [uncultured Caudovirales phage]